MDKKLRLRPFYVANILKEYTDETHYLTIVQINKILEEKYGFGGNYRATIRGDIEALIESGMEIEVEHSTQNRYRLVSRNFDTAELKALIDAVLSSKSISKKKSVDLVRRLGKEAGTHQQKALVRHIEVENRIKGTNEKVFMIVDAINEAITDKKKLSFLYFHYNGQKKKELKNEGEPYIVSPYKLVWNGDFYYMIAWSDKHEKVCVYRVDRIYKLPKVLEESGIPEPADFDMNIYLNSMFRMYSTKRRNVELLCDNDVMDAFIDRFGEKMEVRSIGENQFKTTIQIATNHIFYSWIFGFGGKVSIVGPKEVKEEYVSMLKKALEK